jgi:hypothetical protein
MLNRYAHVVEEQRQAVASATDSILKPLAVNAAVNGSSAKLNGALILLKELVGPEGFEPSTNGL